MNDAYYVLMALYGSMAMWLIGIYLTWAVVVGFAAQNKNRMGIWWFVASLVVSPIVTTLMLMSLGEPVKQCKICRAMINKKARVCDWCDAEQSQVK